MFSERSHPGDGPDPLERALRERRARGLVVLDLAAEDPTTVDLPFDRARIREALGTDEALVHVPSPHGDRRAREALAARLSSGDAPVSAAHVRMTASASEAYAQLLTLLTDPGDEVLVPEPASGRLAHLAHPYGVSLVPYPLRLDDRWSFDAAELWDRLGERTRAIVASSPGEPTGRYLSADALEALSALEVPLIVDERFHDLPLEAAPGPRASTVTETLAFAIGELVLAPQLRVGWIAASGPHAQVHEAMARLAAVAPETCTPAQRALPELLVALEPTRLALLERTASNLRALRAALEGSGADVPHVDGGWLASIRVPSTRSDEAWALALLERGVHLRPGHAYDFPTEEAWLVASLLTPPAALREGAEALARLARDARDAGASFDPTSGPVPSEP